MGTQKHRDENTVNSKGTHAMSVNIKKLHPHVKVTEVSGHNVCFTLLYKRETYFCEATVLERPHDKGHPHAPRVTEISINIGPHFIANTIIYYFHDGVEHRWEDEMTAGILKRALSSFKIEEAA